MKAFFLLPLCLVLAGCLANLNVSWSLYMSYNKDATVLEHNTVLRKWQ